MRIGPVRVMGPGVVLVLCVKEVSDFYALATGHILYLH